MRDDFQNFHLKQMMNNSKNNSKQKKVEEDINGIYDRINSNSYSLNGYTSSFLNTGSCKNFSHGTEIGCETKELFSFLLEYL